MGLFFFIFVLLCFFSKHIAVFPPELDFCSNGIREEALWNLGKIRVITQTLVKESYLPYVSQREL